ncbi:MAG: hypothetical protein IPK73_07740 [Candidatus Obscuribacter sp.]|jgi:phage-related protein|nr:hypothetical protein [Candidatus Obscuribacter sp.]MBK9279492.1 hypothetical protein [Candidatus Obscuribacter sp.]
MSKKQEPEEPKPKEKEEKEVIFWPENLTYELKKDWPEAVRKEGGFQLYRVQQGLEPNNFRPMPTIGAGVSYFSPRYCASKKTTIRDRSTQTKE